MKLKSFDPFSFLSFRKIPMPKKPPYAKSVFVNCPFDKEYLPLFEATIFVIHSLGFLPRCSREIDDGGVRINKIIKIISECQYGIHDLCRTEIDPHTKLPRFNVPLELGIDMGCRYLGGKLHAEKLHLIMDRTPFRYRKLISDLAGNDPWAHNNNPLQVIRIIRNWLSTSNPEKHLPGADFLQKEYKLFRQHMPAICRRAGFRGEIPYKDYSNIVADWIIDRKKTTPPPAPAQNKRRKT